MSKNQELISRLLVQIDATLKILQESEQSVKDNVYYHDGTKWIINSYGTTKVFLLKHHYFSAKWEEVIFDKNTSVKEVYQNYFTQVAGNKYIVDLLREKTEKLQKNVHKLPAHFQTEQEVWNWITTIKENIASRYYLIEAPILYHYGTPVLPLLKFSRCNSFPQEDWKLRLWLNSFFSTLPEKHQACLLDYFAHYPIHKIGDFSAQTDVSLFKEKYSSYLVFPPVTTKEKRIWQKMPYYFWQMQMADGVEREIKEYIVNNFSLLNWETFPARAMYEIERYIEPIIFQPHDSKRLFYFLRALLLAKENMQDILDEPYEMFSEFTINKHTTAKSLLRYIDKINVKRAEETMAQENQSLKQWKRHILVKGNAIAYIPKTLKEIWLESKQLKHCLYHNYREYIEKGKYAAVLIRTFNKDKISEVLQQLQSGNSALFFQEAEEKSTLGVKITLFNQYHIEQHRGTRNSSPPKQHTALIEEIFTELLL